MGRVYGHDEWVREEETGAPCFAGERRDISIEKSASPNDIAHALRLSEERYRYSVALSPLISWIANAGGGVVDIDVRGLERTGLSYEQCMGSGFLSAVHVTDRVVIKMAWAEARITGAPLDYEMRLRQRDGRSVAPRHASNVAAAFCAGTARSKTSRIANG